MSRICLFLCMLFCSTSLLKAQDFLVKGVVMHQGQPVEGASILINGSQRLQTTTVPDGSFVFGHVKPGTYTLTITYTGFADYTQVLEVNGHINTTISLEPLPNQLQPVEVKALRAGTLAPFAKTNLGPAYIRKNNLGQDIPFLLNQTPNVVVNSDAGNGVGYTGIRIRGTDATRINMTINGIPYNDAESQGTFFVNLPDFLSSVSSIQIQRGVGTSSNGAGAFGASMNFSTHEYNQQAYAEVNNSVGSFNTFKHTIKAGSGLINKKFSIDARISQITSDGYIDRASSNLQGAYLSGAWYGKKSTLRLNAILGKEKTYQAWYGISEDDLKTNRTFNSAGTARPGEPYDNETDNYKQNHFQLLYNTDFSSRLTFNTAFYWSTGKGYYEQYRANARPTDYALPLTVRTDLVRQLWLDNNLMGQIFSLQYRNAKHELTWGGGWNYYPGKHFGEVTWTAANPNLRSRWYDLDAFKTDINSYVKWQHEVAPSWHLFADVQYRFVNYDLNGFRNNPLVRFNETWHFVNPKAGITYNEGDWTAFASYAVANKEPNRDDFEAGLTEKPRNEQLHDFEISVEKKNLVKGLTASVTGYYMRYRDQLVLTGKINDVGAYTRTNLPESYRMGVELETRYQWRNGGIRYAAALSKNRVLNFTGYYDDYDNGGQIMINHGNTPIALSPGVVQNATIDWRPFARTEFSLLSKHVGRQYLDNAGEKSRSLNPFWTNDVRMSVDMPVLKFAREIKLVLQVNNILNRMYVPNGYTFSYVYEQNFITENYFYPMAGINWMAALNIRL